MRGSSKSTDSSIGDVVISSVVLAELHFGIELSSKQHDNKSALDNFLQYVSVLDWPEAAGQHYGRICAYLKKRGIPIGANDLLIAAHAMSLDATLVSDNISEFLRVPGLKLENWISR